MKTESHSFQIGEVDCIALNDGNFNYENPGPRFFTNAPADQLAQAALAHGIILDQWKEYLSPFTCLAVRSGQRTILIDTGVGPGFSPGTGKILDCLSEAGISVDQIDTVIITHGHADHIGGNTGNEGRSNFPNAHFYMAKPEWDYWTAEKTMAGSEFVANMVQKNLLGIAEKFTLIDTDMEIIPGIQIIFAPGHLPGHLIVSISSGAERLLYTSDSFIHPIHVEHPEWYTEFENNPCQAVKTRFRVLEEAAQEHTCVLSFHFPFPGLGRITKEMGIYQWTQL